MRMKTIFGFLVARLVADRRLGAAVQFGTSNDAAAIYVGRLAKSLDPDMPDDEMEDLAEVDLKALNNPMAAVNVGLETFTESLTDQNAQVIQVDW